MLCACRVQFDITRDSKQLRTLRCARPTLLRTYSPRVVELCVCVFYLTHFIYGYMASDIWLRTIQIEKEGNVLFNDALNTFYLRPAPAPVELYL